MKIRFTKKPSERSGGSAYEVGQVVDLDQPLAFKWLRRGVAVEVDESEKESASLAADETAVPDAPKPRRRTVSHDDG